MYATLASYNNTNSWSTLLHAAVDRSRIDLLRVLIAPGANVDQPDDEGWTPLCRAGDPKFLFLLDAHDADPSSMHLSNAEFIEDFPRYRCRNIDIYYTASTSCL